ncbi:TrbI/VirB10 family protein [Sphingobium sp. BS19]|uniref:TrbI/VirB10 family protein n=1 Tax=Sphingobium sp. BS19 TaxID=3018973 RepID=UPI0022EF645D|nr:TrbI/VirB10 family protein [Sphingobium sp. BS19]GLI98029.1 conjugal transfer protein TraI [Sphingobium sp. BS19]
MSDPNQTGQPLPDKEDGQPARSQLQDPHNMGGTATPADPSTDVPFRLSGEPPRIVRLSRRGIVILAATGCIGIGGIVVYALQPKAGRLEQLPVSEGRTRAENITSAPNDYAKIPQLGAPLPGDLGRPILAARQRRETVIPAGSSHEPIRTAAQSAAEQKGLAQVAAKTSKLFLATTPSSSAISASGGFLDPDGRATIPSLRDPEASPSSTLVADRRDFLKSGRPGEAASAQRIISPASPYVVQAGTFIPAALITGIRSDLPGHITAQVVENVYDSPTGRILLIPQGAKLIGKYDSEIAAGQRRVLFAWDRLLFPDGASILLDRAPGTDAAGMSGLQDGINHHWTGMLGAALISTLLGVGTELATDNDDTLIQALRYGTQGTINQAGQQLVQRQMAIPPTLTIRPGHSLRVMVTRDLVLHPWERKD